MASNFASYYSSRRDSNGVLILLAKNWPRFSESSIQKTYVTLASQAARLHECYSEIDFLRTRILPPTISGQSYHSARVRQSHTLVKTVDEELKDLGCRLEEHGAVLRLLYVLQTALASYQLGPKPPSLPTPRQPVNPFLEPQMLLRIFLPGKSHTFYSTELGFRSSGSHLQQQTKSVQALIDLGILTRDSLRSHCECHRKPSPFISLTENTKWLLEDSPLAKRPPSTDDHRRVAFVSVEKLRRMGVIYQRSDLLAAQANIPIYSQSQQDGVRFTSVDHWLVYDWIPIHCIEMIVSFEEYGKLYVATGMKGWFAPQAHL